MEDTPIIKDTIAIQPNKTSRQQRPPFPKRAVVTAGMPYGNKDLHFGHVGGLFVHADVYARFLRDRLGTENVIFVSGTDCYGSAVQVTYDELVEKGEFTGTIEDFVSMNHFKQKSVLAQYGIVPDLYAASALGAAGEIHQRFSREIFRALYRAGYLTRMETTQFFDEENDMFLHGRQVRGRCPIQGCKSEFAYADECSLGHQYNPEELIAPVSTISGKSPQRRQVQNWFFDLEQFAPLLRERQTYLDQCPNVRKYLLSVIDEFLRTPMIYVKKEQMEQVLALRTELPTFHIVSEEKKASDALVFATLADRSAACQMFESNQIRYRTGKTLVPFRLSGNIPWGIRVPNTEGVEDLTFWIWPESLWAPISFTQAYLQAQKQSQSPDAWKRWWASKDACVYQFIGEDNIYFYAVAQTGLFLALQHAPEKAALPKDGELQLTTIVPNRHVLYMNRKASSSGTQKPPKAHELLDHYTQEQLRMHFFHLNLASNSVSFAPKSFSQQGDAREYDPVLYEGNILTNIFNRLIRSCFYYMQKYFNGTLPLCAVSPVAVQRAESLILAYEHAMYQFDFGKVIDLLDGYLRDANKYWDAQSKAVAASEDAAQRAQVLVDSFHAVRVATTLLHPIVPDGAEAVRAYVAVGAELWDWSHIFEPLSYFIADPSSHRMRFLAPRVDFFKKHESQLG